MSRDLWLRFEVEGALNGVASAEIPAHAVLGNVHTVLRRFGKVGRRTRNGAEDSVMDRGGSPVRIGVGSHLRFYDLAHTQGPFPVLDSVLNRHRVDCHAFADQTRDVGQRPPELATKDVEDGFPLAGVALSSI